MARLAALPAAGCVVDQLSFRLSGCSNGCALHAAADVGLEGMANRTGNEWSPAYRVWVGGRESEQRPCFGSDLGIVPARNVPNCVAELVERYLQDRQPDESLADMVGRLGTEPFHALVQKFQFAQEQDRRLLMIDWGETEPYRQRTAKDAGVC